MPSEQILLERPPTREGYFAWAPGVHCALAWETPVLLDVRADKYLALPAAAAESVRRLVDQGAGARVELGRRELALWDHLVARRLASTAPRPAPAPSAAGVPRRTALAGWSLYNASIPAVDMADFLRGYWGASWRLNTRGLAACVEHVARVRAQRAPSRATVDLEDLARRYNSVRTLFTARRQKCLIDSLAAFEFFARRGVVGHVMFGVRPAPVTAHAWFECDGVVLNDSAENVDRYTEILRA